MGNVVELKVGLHCEECIKKILKAIKKIEADIETYNADAQLNKVTVTGNVTTEEVVRVLQKIGKMATTWEGEGQGEGEGVNS
ncbi:copper transport protein ATX1 isoform X1 [Prunus dulcis]|uniref:copper transport protein ATX1 isoform X1 n=1 Tax=Prunus dulcis TaxID=3755 RepID=UPI001482A754|nr:copper transport protein ATX1 isoform X1 [Prunus dulcis]